MMEAPMRRRQFISLLPSVAAAFAPAATIREDDPSNTKICHRIDARGISDDDLLFLKQIGIRYGRLEFGAADAPFDYLKATQARFARYDIRILSGVHYSYRSLKVQLGQPGRDKDIETYQRFLRDCGKLGIPIASYDFHPANTYTTSEIQRRGYRTRVFDVEDFRKRVEKQAFEREYSAEDMWANYTYFVKAVLPVAEEAGVRLALHPDDPPVANMNGVAKLFTHYAGYARAEKIAGNSRN